MNPSEEVLYYVQIAEQTILDDLEFLISETITSPATADYAVISGVQVRPALQNLQSSLCRMGRKPRLGVLFCRASAEFASRF